MSTILIVDDSATERAVIASWLLNLGYSVLEAEDAGQGIEMTHNHKPDVVLMDIIMPGKNGFEATRTLHRDPSTHAIPIIIISTKSQISDIAWGKRQGAVAYLSKPFTQAELGKTLAAILATGNA